MTLTRAFLVLLLLPLCPLAWADISPSTPGASSPDMPPPFHKTMNGISYDTFGDFFKKWHFVTARYRKDTGEMRFTYANDIAWKALNKGNVTDYPEGAAFGKVGIKTEDDPAFTSSAVPAGAVRYQIMLRQHGKHPETQNWTYAIFDRSRLVSGPGSDADKAAACTACHAVVKDRGYVFSQPIDMGLGGKMDALNISPVNAGDSPGMRISFRTAKRPEISGALLANLPPGIKEIRLVDGPIAAHVFEGTLDEIRPTLAQEVAHNRSAACAHN